MPQLDMTVYFVEYVTLFLVFATWLLGCMVLLPLILSNILIGSSYLDSCSASWESMYTFSDFDSAVYYYLSRDFSPIYQTCFVGKVLPRVLLQTFYFL